MNLVCKFMLPFLFVAITVTAQSEVIKLSFEEKRIPLRITLPKGYVTDKDYPVLIGPGLDNGDLSIGCRYFGQKPDQHGWILVESSIHMENRQAVASLLDYLESNYNTDKVFILGFSANSVDAFSIASIYTDRIDGIIGMPGNPDSRTIKSHKDQQIVMIVGERDAYWKKKAQRAKVLLDNEGYQNELVVIPNGGHILDELAGKPLFTILNRALVTEN
ncbi:MAG: hypothetical protein Mars2KO_19940 [Maribacter sp.]